MKHPALEHPEDLKRHACAAIREDRADATLWVFTHPDEGPAAIRIHPALSSNDGAVVRQWGLAGLGVILRSEWDVAGDLQTGNLVPLLPGWEPPAAHVVALLGARTGELRETARFLELLGEALKPVPWQPP